MNAIFSHRDKLVICSITHIADADLSIFFSTHKRGIVFIENDLGCLEGYINHESYKNNLNDQIQSIKAFEVIIDQDEMAAWDIAHLMSDESGIDTIPVINQGQFIGAFLRNYSEELNAFDRLMNQVALSVLSVFKDNVMDYLHSRSINCITIDGEKDDFALINKILGKDLKVFYRDGWACSQIVIDTMRSKSYRGVIQQWHKEVMSLEELLTLSLIPVVKKYIAKNKLHILIYEGPIREKLKDCMAHSAYHRLGLSLEEMLSSEEAIFTFASGNKSVYNFLKNTKYGPLQDNYVISNGVNLIMAIPNRGQRQQGGLAVHMFGPCLTYGVCVPNEYTIPAILGRLIKASNYEVINHGVKNGHSLLNDFLYILSTKFRPGDYVVVINAFSSYLKSMLEKSFPVVELSSLFNENAKRPWFFLDNTFHVNHIANEMIANQIKETIAPQIYLSMHIGDVLPSYFDCEERISLVDSTRLLEKGLLGSYREYLLAHKRELSERATIGSVLLTANPITKGHEYLIQYAKQKCDLLYVFIVEEDMFFFSTIERMMLCQKILSDTNIILLTTGNLMTARFTFPEYFSKDVCDVKIHQSEIPDIHCNIFAGFVCPLLGITKRFVGEETPGSVTDAYNKKLLSVLPAFGVEVEIIPRCLTGNGCVISSSTVRKMIEQEYFDGLSAFLSMPVVHYIEGKWRKKH